MVIVGALVRTARKDSQTVQTALARLEGVDVHSFEDPTKIGLVIEAATLNQAYYLLEDEISGLPGVWTVYPVYANFEEAAAVP